MRMLILDASIIAKWYNKEEYSDKAIEIREKYIDGLLDIKEPALILYEVSNAIYKNDQLNIEDAMKAVESLMRLIEATIEIPSNEDAKEMMKIARSLKISFYDSSYIQIAKKYNAKLITADDEMYRKAKKLIEITHIKDV